MNQFCSSVLGNKSRGKQGCRGSFKRDVMPLQVILALRTTVRSTVHYTTLPCPALLLSSLSLHCNLAHPVPCPHLRPRLPALGTAASADDCANANLLAHATACDIILLFILSRLEIKKMPKAEREMLLKSWFIRDAQSSLNRSSPKVDADNTSGFVF